MVLKLYDSIGKSWKHHADVVKNNENINLMDLNSLFRNLTNYEETKVVRKDIIKDSNKEKFMALVSRKEATNIISDSNDSNQGEGSNDDITDELVARVAFIVKRHEESKSNRVRRVLSKGGSSTRKHNSEKNLR